MQEKIKILLIEDNPADVRLVDVHLRESFNSGYTLEICNYLSKGLEQVRQNKYDTIIVDLSLPDSVGMDAFTQVFACSPDCPIIILTGANDELMGVSAVKLGAQDFLIKGKTSSTTIKRSINYSLQRHKLLKELEEKTKKLEERTTALIKEQLQLADAQKIAHIGSWEWDLASNSLSWSEELYRIYGLNPYEKNITSEKVFKMTHKDDLEHIKTIITESRKTTNPFIFLHRIIVNEKTVKTLQVRGEVLADSNGLAVKMIGTEQDITERQRDEELEKLANAATKSYNSVIISNKEGKVEWVNDGFIQMFGYKLEDIKGTSAELLRKGNKTGITVDSDPYNSLMQERKSVTYENKNYSKDGKEYWLLTTITPILDANGEVERIISIDADITRRKNMEEELMNATKIAEHSLMKGNKALTELMAAKKQLEESLKVKEQFLANMSHEIRTPMNAIIGFTDLILKTDLSEEQKQFLDAIKISGRNLIVIINDILDISRIQSGKIQLEQIDFSLTKLVHSITQMMQQKALEKKIKLSAHIEERIPDKLIGDPTRLNQILVNLLGNSIKFTEEGEVTASVHLVSETLEGLELKFSIADTGIGIPENKLVSIFDAFTQATNETTRKYGGTGLGLAIVKQLVGLMGGTVAVKSKERVGSTFTITIAFKKNIDSQPENENGTKKAVAMDEIERLNVLLVEDNLLNQVLAKKVLTDWKWKVETAENGNIAIDKLKKKDFDIVLMDIQMPEMDGYETTRYIRKKFKEPKCNVPIMAMTAHAMSSEEEKCRGMGMNGYISKPFDQKVFYERIVSVLRDCGYRGNKKTGTDT